MAEELNIDEELRQERDAYLRELRADLEDLEILILDLAKPEGAERKRKLARDVHSIKGLAGSYGLALISMAVHRMEDDLALQEIVESDADGYIDRLLKHKDQIGQLALAYANDDEQALADFQVRFAGFKDPPAPAGDANTALASLRVLLIDNSRTTLKACVRVLKEMGIVEIATMQDGYEALGRLLREPFHAVITGLYVPGIDGQSLMPVLRIVPGPNQATPVILLTASAATLGAKTSSVDFVVEKNPTMVQRLRRILSELGGIAPAAAAAPKPGRELKKIVLVDDSPAIHQLMKLSFKRFPGVTIASLEDSSGAVDFVRGEQPDLVLLDVNMPRLSGKEVIGGIKATDDLREIPVAFLTADSSDDERANLLDLGAWRVFKKPFLPKTFAEELIQLYEEK